MFSVPFISGVDITRAKKYGDRGIILFWTNCLSLKADIMVKVYLSKIKLLTVLPYQSHPLYIV